MAKHLLRPVPLTLYLFGVSLAAFMLPASIKPIGVALLFVLQLVLLALGGHLSWTTLRVLDRLKFLFLFLVLMNVVFGVSNGGGGGGGGSQGGGGGGGGRGDGSGGGRGQNAEVRARADAAQPAAIEIEAAPAEPVPIEKIVQPVIPAPRWWPGWLQWDGLLIGITMCGQISIVVLASHLIRTVGDPDSFVRGLRTLRVAPLFAYSLDISLALISGADMPTKRDGDDSGDRNQRDADPPVIVADNQPLAEVKAVEDHGRGQWGGGGGGGGGGGQGGQGRGGGRRDGGQGRGGRGGGGTGGGGGGGQGAGSIRGGMAFWSAIRHRDLTPLATQIQQTLAASKQRAIDYGLDERRAHDVAVIGAIGATMMTLKIIKIMPGMPVIAGMKSIFFIPLYIIAAEATRSRWGATVAGTIMGVIGFLNGDGRYGVFEVFKHTVPGVLIDLCWPLLSRFPRRRWVFMAIGITAAIGRTSSELVMTLALGANAEIWLFPLWKLVPNLIAGVLSSYVAMGLLKVLMPERGHLIGGEATTWPATPVDPAALANPTSKEPGPQESMPDEPATKVLASGGRRPRQDQS